MQLIDTLHAFIWDSKSVNNCSTCLIPGKTPIVIDPGHRNVFGRVESGG
jgi:hypothetical protein